MKGLAIAIIGLWVILQTTKGPLAEKIGLTTGVPSAPSNYTPQGGGPPTGQQTQAACEAAGGTWQNGQCYASA